MVFVTRVAKKLEFLRDLRIFSMMPQNWGWAPLPACYLGVIWGLFGGYFGVVFP